METDRTVGDPTMAMPHSPPHGQLRDLRKQRDSALGEVRALKQQFELAR